MLEANDVVSLDHEFLVELFRRRPELARELLRRCQNLEIPGERAELGSIDLTQLAPVEYRSDAVVVTRDAQGRAIAAVVVEVQLGLDERKRYTWPVYVTALRAKLECSVTLLVIAPELAVARWCATPIRIGGGMSLVPNVVSFDDVPRITTRTSPRSQPELSILSALAQEDLRTIELALEELRRLPEDEQDVHFDLLERTLPAAWRRLQMDFKNYEFKGETYQRAIAASHDDGRRQVLCTLIAAKFGVPMSSVAPRLSKLDGGQLEVLITKILSAADLETLFGAVEKRES